MAASQHPQLAEAFERCIAGLVTSTPPAVLQSRLLELVAWLHEEGIEPFAGADTTRLRVKRLLGGNPSRR